MIGYKFVKGYRGNDILRESFNQLAYDTFGISFEKWYKLGFWTDKYEPYSYIDGDKVIANVSVNQIDLVIDGEHRKAIQIGTVMTHPDHRGKGLSAELMKKVMEDYQGADIAYLFANKTVLEYYPRFGFSPVGEHQPLLKLEAVRGKELPLKKLDGCLQEDIDFIYDLAQRRKPVSTKFSAAGNAELLMFYCTYAFPDDIYYCPEKEAVILMKVEGETMHLFDVICSKEIDIEELAAGLAPAEVKEVLFHFTVESTSDRLISVPFKGEEVMFVITAEGLVLPEIFKHPITSQA
ncbi:GNAT family N-acetyltransferase [Bacillus salacetis]|uniref:GNAT family N-acetyltransferase n=1 Tax=Bacillus salacetis TaxID=2315464 RepID=A0A3A1R7Z9_9BACI|nr:GNAT family N-acetyltransferase [Bacillus salacetis]RIW39010.1 GNAT family N-acetyltransferase [Bacillus salacetis]